MIGFRRNLPAYLQIAWMWMQIIFTYRANFAFYLLSTLIQVFLLRVVWTAVYAEQDQVDGIALETLIVYLTIANLQTFLLHPSIAGHIQQRVRDGVVAVDLARPTGFLGQMLSGQIGGTVAHLPFVLLALPVAFVLGDLAVPPSVGSGLFYLVSLVLAYLVVVLLGLMLGLIAFWTLEIQGFLGLYYFISGFFAGTLVPLWFFPEPMRTVAEVLPFQAIAFVPVAIYVGETTGGELARALALQGFWVVALFRAAQRFWRRTFRHVVIQGG